MKYTIDEDLKRIEIFGIIKFSELPELIEKINKIIDNADEYSIVIKDEFIMSHPQPCIQPCTQPNIWENPKPCTWPYGTGDIMYTVNTSNK